MQPASDPAAAEALQSQHEPQPQPQRLEARQHQQAWTRLWDCPAGNRAKVLGWRLAHASLPCGLYLAAKRGPEPGATAPRHLCPELVCAGQRRRPQDSLTHVFLQCPAYAAARQWFGDFWAAVSGGPPPPTDCAALMLGDQPQAWPHHPAAGTGGQRGGLTRLWNAVRLTFLFAVWCARNAAEGQPRGSRAVVQQVVEELQRLMWAQFRAAAWANDTISALPPNLLSADLKPPPLQDFCAVWAHGEALCRVATDANGRPYLQLRLSLQHPVPLPAAEVGVAAADVGVRTG